MSVVDGIKGGVNLQIVGQARVLGNHTFTQTGGMSMENNSVTHSDVPTTKLDSRSAVIDQGSIDNIQHQIDYTKNHSIKSFFGGIADKVQKGSLNVELAKEFKAKAPTLNTMLNGGVDGKLKPLKTWLQQDSDGSYSFMMQIKDGVSDAAVNEKIEALYAEAAKAALSDPTKIKFDGKILTIDGKKINLPVKGYPENYIMFTASSATTGSKGENNVTLVIPNTAESKKKFEEMSNSAEAQIKILENIGKLYEEGSNERKAIEQFKNYQQELNQIRQKFSDKFDPAKQAENIKFAKASMPNAEIITRLLNSAEAVGITSASQIKGTTLGGHIDSQFTSFASNGDHKIATSQFNPATNTITATVNNGQPLAGNTCILYQEAAGKYSLYTYTDGKFKKEEFKAADVQTTEADQSKINHHISMRLGELRSSGTEILLAKGTGLYTMGHGKELDLMITGTSATGFTANISGQGVDKLQGNSEQKVVTAIQDIFSNLGKAGTKIDQLAKAKLEVAAMMIANREKYGNFADANKPPQLDQKQVAEFIKSVIEPKYKLTAFEKAKHPVKAHLVYNKLEDDDYDTITKFITDTMVGDFVANTGKITTALAAIEKGAEGKIEIPNIFGADANQPLTISFDKSKQLTDWKAALGNITINKKNIKVDDTLDALTDAAADPKFKKADKPTEDATTFADLSLLDKLKVLQQAQAKAKLANQLIELNAAYQKPEDYIPLLNKLTCNTLLEDIKVNLSGNKQVSELLASAYTCLSAAHKAEQTAYTGEFKFDQEPFTRDGSKEKTALYLLKSAGITTTSAQELFQAFTKNDNGLLKVDDLEAGKTIAKDGQQDNCAKFSGGIAKAICNAQLVGLTL